jgi:hypothetical protein
MQECCYACSSAQAALPNDKLYRRMTARLYGSLRLRVESDRLPPIDRIILRRCWCTAWVCSTESFASITLAPLAKPGKSQKDREKSGPGWARIRAAAVSAGARIAWLSGCSRNVQPHCLASSLRLVTLSLSRRWWTLLQLFAPTPREAARVGHYAAGLLLQSQPSIRPIHNCPLSSGSDPSLII